VRSIGADCFLAASESRNLLEAIPAEKETMAKPEHPREVRVRRYNGCLECDVVVTVRGREMVVQLPDYSQAVTWAQMEAKSYGIAAEFSEGHAS
jgi:hypothetical protein